ncbi:hypothetical protein WN51_07463 [Melipona quadrifasciata]|uniref:Uncharacterized protein n=1 Tax=Melipona quadrifasciata TaxID=166423 RepID=A0A0N0U721_9HYME|nr:hypothetical protein WN51_07463 [Melipona quadrifasciata]
MCHIVKQGLQPRSNNGPYQAGETRPWCDQAVSLRLTTDEEAACRHAIGPSALFESLSAKSNFGYCQNLGLDPWKVLDLFGNSDINRYFEILFVKRSTFLGSRLHHRVKFIAKNDAKKFASCISFKTGRAAEGPAKYQHCRTIKTHWRVIDGNNDKSSQELQHPSQLQKCNLGNGKLLWVESIKHSATALYVTHGTFSWRFDSNTSKIQLLALLPIFRETPKCQTALVKTRERCNFNPFSADKRDNPEGKVSRQIDSSVKKTLRNLSLICQIIILRLGSLSRVGVFMDTSQLNTVYADIIYLNQTSVNELLRSQALFKNTWDSKQQKKKRSVDTIPSMNPVDTREKDQTSRVTSNFPKSILVDQSPIWQTCHGADRNPGCNTPNKQLKLKGLRLLDVIKKILGHLLLLMFNYGFSWTLVFLTCIKYQKFLYGTMGLRSREKYFEIHREQYHNYQPKNDKSKSDKSVKVEECRSDNTPSIKGSKKRRVEIKGKQSERLSECRSPLRKVAGERGGEKRRVFDAEERKGGRGKKKGTEGRQMSGPSVRQAISASLWTPFATLRLPNPQSKPHQNINYSAKESNKHPICDDLISLKKIFGFVCYGKEFEFRWFEEHSGESNKCPFKTTKGHDSSSLGSLRYNKKIKQSVVLILRHPPTTLYNDKISDICFAKLTFCLPNFYTGLVEHAAKNETDYWVYYQSMREQANGQSAYPGGYQTVNQQVYANPDCSQSQNFLPSTSILENILRNGRKIADQGYFHSAENPMIPTNTENVPPICCQYSSCSPTATNGASPTVGYPSNAQEQTQHSPGQRNRYLVNYHGYPITVTTSINSSVQSMIPSSIENYEVQQRYERYTNVSNNEESSPNRTDEQASTDEYDQSYVTYPWMKSSNGNNVQASEIGPSTSIIPDESTSAVQDQSHNMHSSHYQQQLHQEQDQRLYNN